MKRFIFVAFFLIAALAVLLRFWQLGIVPPSPDWDEAALGYNAYSIMQTGKDEYGKQFPVILRSFDDYKPALYAYFVIPSISLFGLNLFSVRFPSAFFGVLTVLSVYFLVRELFSDKEEEDRKIISIPLLAVIVMLLLAVSPWHLQFSRIAFESNVGTAFNVFTVLFFLKGLKRPFFLSLSAATASLALYVYQSEKVFTPLFLFFLIVIFRKEIMRIPKKYLLAAVFIGLLLSSRLLLETTTNKEALARAKGVSVFSNQQALLKTADRQIVDKENGDYLGLLIDNRRVLFVKQVFSGYLSHFDLNWLFLTGDIARHHAPGMGLLYLWELPFLLIGIYTLIFTPFGRRWRKASLVIFAWFFLAPLPASVTSGVPHAVRTLNFLPTFQIFTAVGILSFAGYLYGRAHRFYSKERYVVFAAILIFALFNFSYYLDQYFVQQNYFNSKEWQYGYKPAIEEINRIGKDYDKIIVTNQPPLDQSYMFFLFYLAYPPDKYQQESTFTSGGFRETHMFDKFEFRPIAWDKEEKQGRLFIGRPVDFPPAIHAVSIINYLNGEQGIKIVRGEQ